MGDRIKLFKSKVQIRCEVFEALELCFAGAALSFCFGAGGTAGTCSRVLVLLYLLARLFDLELIFGFNQLEIFFCVALHEVNETVDCAGPLELDWSRVLAFRNEIDCREPEKIYSVSTQ